MLQSIKQLYGETLRASDGEIGHVKDFYFDDTNWAVRYLVVDTGSWLLGRLVLISPHAFGCSYQDGEVLHVNLTRKQIENSPSIETHKPVSRQYEEEYYQYYGWPSYWPGDAMGGISDYPAVPPPTRPYQKKQANGDGDPHNDDDSHLRSTQAMSGYHIQASDGTIGHVSDFIMDDKSWAIRRLVVETGHWLSGKEVLISLSKIDRISYEESKVFVNLTKEAIQQAPEYYVPPVDTADHDKRDSATEL
jgi:sporulation protein YlmC with PRC-barrel domain